MMSKKHYVMIAAAIRKDRHPDGLMWATNIANTLADGFAKDNPNFDRARFFAACNPKQE